MDQTTRNVVAAVLVGIIIVLLGYFDWQERKGVAAPTPTATTTTATSGNVSIAVSGTATTSTSGYTIKPIYGTPAPTAPNYKTPLSFPAGTSASDEASYQSQFATIQTTLASQPKDYDSWLGLGILRKETGDYSGAAADLKYVTELYPSDPTAYADLGDLYANYLKQPSQGIAYYKQAIALDPTKEETFYQNLAQIYINEGNATAAKAVLQQGITAQVVGYQNLQTELNSMQ